MEIKELLLDINTTVERHGLDTEFISCIAVGFIDVKEAWMDEDGEHRANLNLLSSFSVQDEEELDDLLSFCLESFIEQQKQDTSSIDYWLRLANRNNGGDLPS